MSVVADEVPNYICCKNCPKIQVNGLGRETSFHSEHSFPLGFTWYSSQRRSTAMLEVKPFRAISRFKSHVAVLRQDLNPDKPAL